MDENNGNTGEMSAAGNNDEKKSDLIAAKADKIGAAKASGGSSEQGPGAVVAVLVLFLVIAAFVFYFLTKKPSSKMDAIMSVLPQESVLFLSVDMSRIDDPAMKKEIIEKLQNSIAVKSITEELQQGKDVDIKEDILTWMDEQMGVSLFSYPNIDVEPTSTPELAAVISVRDMKKAQEKINALIEKSGIKYTDETYESVTIKVPEESAGKPPVLAFVNNVLVMSTSVESTKKCIDASRGKGKSLKDNAAVAASLKKLPPESAGIMFIDILKAMEASPETADNLAKNPEVEKFVKSINGVSIGIGTKNKNIVGGGFLSLNKNAESSITKAILQAKPAIGTPVTATLFPKEASYYAVLDAKAIYSIVLKVLETQPGGKENLENAKQEFEKETGINVDKDIIENLTGELAYSIEFDDIIQQQMSTMGNMTKQESEFDAGVKQISTALNAYAMDKDGKFPESLNMLVPTYLDQLPGTPEGMIYFYRKNDDKQHFLVGYSKDNGKSASDDYPSFDSEKGLQNSLSSDISQAQNATPLVVVAKLKDKDKVKQAAEKLFEKFGQGTVTTKEYSGVPMYVLPGNGGTVAFYNDNLMIGMGIAQKRLEKIIDNKMDEKKSIASSEGFGILRTQLSKNTMTVGMMQFERILPMMQMMIGIAAAQQGPQQAEIANEVLSAIEKYSEIWTYSELEDDGFKFNFVALKKDSGKTDDKK